MNAWVFLCFRYMRTCIFCKCVVCMQQNVHYVPWSSPIVFIKPINWAKIWNKSSSGYSSNARDVINNVKAFWIHISYGHKTAYLMHLPYICHWAYNMPFKYIAFLILISSLNSHCLIINDISAKYTWGNQLQQWVKWRNSGLSLSIKVHTIIALQFIFAAIINSLLW